jgi:UDP-N-acetyl-2-amino-2-deoxyglucuronate dehydrogenase
MKKYGVGIVGFGWVAGAHMSTFVSMPSFTPVAIMSRRSLDPAQIEKQYGAKVRVYNDYDKFLADKDLDVVDICTPHPFHSEQTVKAAKAGKHLIIEKPIALDFESACRMLEAVEKNKVRTSVCVEVRFISGSTVARSIIDRGLLGDIYYAEADYYHGIGPWYGQFAWNVKKNMGGSSLLTAGCHALDIMLWLVGQEVEEVFSYSTKNPNEIFKPYEYDTTSITIMKFKNGKTLAKVASVTDCIQPYVFNVNLVGSHGAIMNRRFYSSKLGGPKEWSELAMQLADSGDVAHHPYTPQFAHFAECLDAGKETINSLASSFESHRVIYAADKSAATGKPVRLSEFTR